MSKTLAPSKLGPTEPQTEKLHTRVQTLARKMGIQLEPRHVQAAFSYPGTGLEEKYLNIILEYYTLATGMTIPFAVSATGLVPEGWVPEKDDLLTEVDLSRLDFSYCPVQKGESYINGDTLIERADQQKAIGGLWLAKAILDAQKQGKQVIPEELRGKYIILPRTILRDPDGYRLVAYLSWDGEQWYLDFSWLDLGFGSDYRLVRFSE